jgi:ribonuclease BN (tRNA processing enzyme)
MPLAPSSLITLGTGGGPVLNPVRSQPAFVLMNETRPVLIDCGEGAMSQLKRAGIEFREVGEIFLTHHHFDHIGSLFTCLGLNMMTMRRTPLAIHGPRGTARILEGLLSACDVPQEQGFGVAGQTMPHPRDFVLVREMSPGDVVRLGTMTVTACENTHYRPEAAFGAEGPVSLSFRFDMPERSIVVTGDTGECLSLERLARGADLMIGEMMDLELTMGRVRANNPQVPDVQIDRIRQHLASHHLSPEQLGDLAARAGVAHVVAVHFPPGVATPETAGGYVERIAARFTGRVEIGQDLAVY